MNINQKRAMSLPFVSIIVPAFNSASTISICLRSLLRLEYPRDKYEIIVVDDGSTDNTQDIVKAHSVKLIRQKNNGPAAARNAGIKQAKGEILAFTDADCIVERDWLTQLLKYYPVCECVGGVGGQLRLLKHSKTCYLIDKFDEERYKQFLKGVIVVSEPYAGFLGTSNCSYHKGVLVEAGGFDKRFSKPGGEDADLSQLVLKKNYRLIFSPEIIVWHNVDYTLLGYFKKYFHRVEGDMIYESKHHQGTTFVRTLLSHLVRMAFAFSIGRNAKNTLEKIELTLMEVLFNLSQFLGRVRYCPKVMRILRIYNASVEPD